MQDHTHIRIIDNEVGSDTPYTLLIESKGGVCLGVKCERSCLMILMNDIREKLDSDN